MKRFLGTLVFGAAIVSTIATSPVEWNARDSVDLGPLVLSPADPTHDLVVRFDLVGSPGDGYLSVDLSGVEAAPVARTVELWEDFGPDGEMLVDTWTVPAGEGPNGAVPAIRLYRDLEQEESGERLHLSLRLVGEAELAGALGVEVAFSTYDDPGDDGLEVSLTVE